ncbi:hypothetical protein OS493_028776 [Desmophyllum pertusum]|uniref:Uncharacterized protein n=1 Tax=Desmophyllum pertusum TaxID=174260 RepID=A0A9W9ZXQ7_9CNID|nr:hypothetical protein OS493_028776 [Desmophyllum pertusum]
MSRYPHRRLAEKNKRVQTQNCIEGKFLKQKLDSYSREKLYIDRELRRISLAKESLMESLDRYTVPPKMAKKRLSLPCLMEGKRRDASIRQTSALRRHTVDSVQELHKVVEGKKPLKPLCCDHDPLPPSKMVFLRRALVANEDILRKDREVHFALQASKAKKTTLKSGLLVQ